MRNFFIITNQAKDPERAVTRGMEAYLRMHGAAVTAREHASAGSDEHTDPSEVPAGTDCVIVLGGDGTLMRAAGDLIDRQIPFLGINLGTLGYLAEIDRHSIYPALDALLQDNYQIEHRMLLHGDVWQGGRRVYTGCALNDILVSRRDMPHVITLRNYVNDAYLYEYRADGVIVSTPTGSTGYSLSAGGPIIAPEAELFLLTPLAAHTLNSRSVVLPADDTRIRIQVGPGKDNTEEHALVAFDGESVSRMLTDDYVEIRKEDRSVRMVKIQQDSFLETLRRKMNH